MSRIILNPPQVANFFAYFDPKERQGFSDILFVICCPAHRSKDVKQDLEKAGLKPCEATSRRDMIPGHDKAFVFVSGGINFVSSKDMAGGFYLGLVQILSKRKKVQRSFVQSNTWQDVLVSAASSLHDVPETSWGKVSLFSFFLVPTRAKRRL